MDEEEKLLSHLIPENELLDRLTWRRWAIRNLAEGDRLKFMQEYPATPEEACSSDCCGPSDPPRHSDVPAGRAGV